MLFFLQAIQKETEKQRVSGEKREGIGGWRRERRRPWAHSPLLRGVCCFRILGIRRGRGLTQAAWHSAWLLGGQGREGGWWEFRARSPRGRGEGVWGLGYDQWLGDLQGGPSLLPEPQFRHL